MHGWRDDIAAAARGESKPENLMYIMFAHTEASQEKGREFAGRFVERQRLTAIKSPTLIIQGDNGLMIPTKLSHLMAGLIPDARIRVYPDAAPGLLFQYPAEVAADVNAVLAREEGSAGS
jgi:pimeloyl-ACP methyl ester carboxylesterase